MRAELLETHHESTSITTREKSLRDRDGLFRSLLLIEGADEGAVTVAADRLELQSSGNVFAQVFQL